MKFDTEFKAKYKIKKVINNDFLTVHLIDTGDFKCEVKDCCLSGKFRKVYPGDTFVSECVFKKDEKNGYLLKSISTPTLELPSSETELAKYVGSQVKGLSKSTATKVISRLGINFIGTVNENPEVLKGIDLTKKQREALIEWCDSHFNLHTLIGDAYLRGVAPEEIFDIYKKYGSKIITMLKQDPYTLYFYGLMDFNKIDKISLKEGNKKNGELRASGYAYFLIDNAESLGSMAVTKEEIYKEMSKEGFDDTTIWKGIEYLIQNNFIDKAQFDNDIYYGKRNNMYAERIIADFIKENKDIKMYSYATIDKHFRGSELNKQQREAVYTCLSKKISFLTGGPGTGKTFTIKRIIRTATNIKPDISVALMAPTGKAASRMVEVIGMGATTIHAALGLSEGDDILHKDGMILDKDLIIIDEASMIDEVLFSYFCRHIGKKTQIIFVGDTGQLPSVNAGNLLSVLSQQITKFELTTIVRQNKISPIVKNAHLIRNDDAKNVIFNEDDDFQFIETTDVIETVNSLYNKYRFETSAQNIMILSPQHNKNGTDQLNIRIQEDNDDVLLKVYNRNIFKRHDRVIQLKNVKKLDIHNGDQGEVYDTKDKGLEILFDGKDDPIYIKDLDNIELAYSITVHKSQGSEADIVIMVFNDAHLFTLSKQLIYTALTRTKTTFIGVGNLNAFYKGCLKEEKPRLSLIDKYIDKFNKIEEEENKPVEIEYDLSDDDSWIYS